MYEMRDRMTHVDIAATIAPEDKLSKTLLNDIKINEKSIDIVELRIDQWPSFNKALLNEVIKQLKIFHLKILVTYRTSIQGGKGAVNEQEYLNILSELIECPQFDMIDIEWSSAVKIEKYTHLVQRAQQKGLEVVLSHHNFQETPENMMEILSELTSLNPKLVKVAVMAHTEQDVLDLMNYTRGFKTLNPEQEYVTISMGKVGKVSRITADVTGSSWSFASLDEASAPGQISLANMKKIREILDEA